MKSVWFKKSIFGLIYLVISALLIRYINPLNHAIFDSGSWLYFKLGPGGYEWFSSDYEWGNDPATFILAIIALIAIALIVSFLAKKTRYLLGM